MSFVTSTKRLLSLLDVFPVGLLVRFFSEEDLVLGVVGQGRVARHFGQRRAQEGQGRIRVHNDFTLLSGVFIFFSNIFQFSVIVSAKSG